MSVLSRIILEKSRAARLNITDAYMWHKRLWEAFPNHDGKQRDFLFRIDDTGRNFRAFVLSRTEPLPPDWGSWASKKIADTFLDHITYRFQLKANPTFRRNSDRRRIGIYSEDKLKEWMYRKSTQNGFNIIENTLTAGAPIEESFVKKGRKGIHVAVDFQGALEVDDKPKFHKAFTGGIGSAKAFGFGLLILEPVR